MPGTQQTLLDTKSSSVQKTLRPTYRETILQNCGDELLSAEYIYGYIDQEEGVTTTEKFARRPSTKTERLLSCRTNAFFYRNRISGALKVGSSSCHLRHCPICSKAKELTIRGNTMKWLKTARFAKLLTFTLKHSEDSLNDRLDKLYDSFRAIRRLSLIKKACYGGIWFFQVKKSKSDNLWHPHLHCLVAGAYIPQNKIAQQWYRITGDSKVVDIRAIKSAEVAAKYVARYSAKPCTLSYLSLDDCVVLAKAVENRRLCGTWGECRKLKLTSPPDFDKSEWYQIASWGSVFANRNVDDNAKAIIKSWKTGKPLPSGIDLKHLTSNYEEIKAMSERGSPAFDDQFTFEWR